MKARRRRPVWLLLLLSLPGVPPGRLPAQDAARGVAVEPADLARRPDLVGREVVVNDRVSRFQFHRETGFDQIYLKRAPEVAMELPPRLRPRQSQPMAVVQVRGTLKRDGERFWVDVASYEPQPNDLDRLNRAVARLGAADAEARTGWARWAERRAVDFDDQPLLKRARELEAEALRIEADRPPSRDPAGHWLALADRARAAHLDEPEPSALAHRGFRAALAADTTADQRQALVGRIEAFFPEARSAPAEPVNLSKWDRGYAQSPADGYRDAPPAARAGLDHRLWADAEQQLIERRAGDDPKQLLALADEAGRLLPDRPGFAGSLLARGADDAAGNVATLRQSEVEVLAKLFRGSLRQPERAESLYRSWLDDQRDRRLSPRDAEGRLALADQYETLLNDKAAAIVLLRAAAAIDPDSREVADAYRRRGFRKINGEWVESDRDRDRERVAVAPIADGSSAPDGETRSDPHPTTDAGRPAPSAGRPTDDTLRNATPEEVRVKMGGKPNRKVMVASQGQMIEQWIYLAPRETHYINFLRQAGSRAHVISFHSLPRNLLSH